MQSSMTIITNADSGDGNDAAQSALLRESLASAGVEADIALARSGAEIRTLAERALDGGCGMLVAGGGDGTVSTLASLVAGTDVTLGVLPLGTLNHFAKDLRIPLDLDDAVRTLLHGAIARVDVGEVNGAIFINNSSLGLYPHMVTDRNRQQQRLGRNKWLALAWSALAMLGRYPALKVSLAVDGKEKVTTTPIVFIGNNEYEIHGLDIGTRPRLDAGVLSLYLPHHVGRAGLLWMAVRALVGTLRDADEFDEARASEIRIDTRAKQIRVALDGEVRTMQTPLLYRIIPGALRVMVPPGNEKSRDEKIDAMAAA